MKLNQMVQLFLIKSLIFLYFFCDFFLIFFGPFSHWDGAIVAIVDDFLLSFVFSALASFLGFRNQEIPNSPWNFFLYRGRCFAG